MSNSDPTFSVVLPLYNEEDNAPRIETELIPVLQAMNVSWEIVAVNDGSADKTAEILQKLSAREPRVRIETHEKNRGLGAAVRTGISSSGGTYVATLDGDFTFHPRILPKLLEKIEMSGADCVIGSPFAGPGGLVGIPRHRLILTHISNWMYRCVLGARVTSITAICRLYRKTALETLHVKSDGFSINAEILAQLLSQGRKIEEIPATLEGRILGTSKAGLVRETTRHLSWMARMLVARFGVGRLLAIFTPILITAFVFSPTFKFGFLNWDDPEYLTAHPWYLPLTLQNVFRMWDPRSLWNGIAVDYSPVRDMSYVMDHILYGWNAAGFHFTQIALHALNAALLAAWLLRFVSWGPALICALVWSVHPLMVESVSWVSARKDLLMGFWFLVTFHVVASSHRRLARWSGLAACLSKPPAASLGLLGFAPIWPKDRGPTRKTSSLWLACGALVVLLSITANLHSGLVISKEKNAVSSQWPAGFQVVFHAAEKILWPFDLSARYVQHPSWNLLRPEVGAGLAVAALLVALTLLLYRKNHSAFKGLLFSILTFLPYLPIVPVHIWMADRYLYVPTMGIAWALASGLNGWPRKIRFAGIAALSLALVFLVPMTRDRLKVWSSSLALWTDTVRSASSLYYVWGNLGTAQLEAGDPHGAIDSLTNALYLYPKLPRAILDLARAHIEVGQDESARRGLDKYESIADPREFEATKRQRATAWAQLRESDRAEKLFKEWLVRRPGDFVALTNYGVLLAVTGREGEALERWGQAVRANGGYSPVRLNLAKYYFLRKDCASLTQQLSKMKSPSDEERAEAMMLQRRCP